VPAETQALTTRRTERVRSLSPAVMVWSRHGGVKGLRKVQSAKFKVQSYGYALRNSS
jgi:hypothetical protein